MPDTAFDVILYSDGACRGNPGPGGWACILKHPASGKTKELSGGEAQTTNNRMELTAVIRGLEALKAGRRLRVNVVTDSEYVQRGMTEWVKGWIRNGWRKGRGSSAEPVKNAELWQRLVELVGAHDVTFTHVYGHAGHPENERCDRLAVEAALRFA